MSENREKTIICLDTNVLLNIFDIDIYGVEVLDKFIKGLVRNDFTLILPKLVIDEWDRNLPKIHEEKAKEIALLKKKYGNLLEYIEDENEKKQISSIFDNVIKYQLRIQKYGNESKGERVNDLIHNTLFTEVIDRNSYSDKLVVDFALKKKEPFFSNDEDDKRKQNDKNEAADASIFFTFYCYLKENKVNADNIYFVTENKRDYSQKNDSSKIHENLYEFAKEVNITFSNNIKGVLKKIVPSIIIKYQNEAGELLAESHDVNFIEELNRKHISDDFFVKCPKCKGELHINVDVTIQRSTYAGHYQTYWYVCPSCKHTWDTGDSPLDDIY